MKKRKFRTNNFTTSEVINRRASGCTHHFRTHMEEYAFHLWKCFRYKARYANQRLLTTIIEEVYITLSHITEDEFFEATNDHATIERIINQVVDSCILKVPKATTHDIQCFQKPQIDWSKLDRILARRHFAIVDELIQRTPPFLYTVITITWLITLVPLTNQLWTNVIQNFGTGDKFWITMLAAYGIFTTFTIWLSYLYLLRKANHLKKETIKWEIVSVVS